MLESKVQEIIDFLNKYEHSCIMLGSYVGIPNFSRNRYTCYTELTYVRNFPSVINSPSSVTVYRDSSVSVFGANSHRFNLNSSFGGYSTDSYLGEVDCKVDRSEYTYLLDEIVKKVPTSIPKSTTLSHPFFERIEPCDNPVWKSLNSLAKPFSVIVDVVDKFENTKESICVLSGQYIDLQESIYVVFDKISQALLSTYFCNTQDFKSVKYVPNAPVVLDMQIPKESKYYKKTAGGFSLVNNDYSIIDSESVSNLVFKVSKTSEEFLEDLEYLKFYLLSVKYNSINYSNIFPFLNDKAYLSLGYIQ